MPYLIELKPDKKLLDPDFGGYKLSLEPIPIWKVQLLTGVDHVMPNEDQYTFLHVKLFTLHNHLYSHPENLEKVYFVDQKWKISSAQLRSNASKIREVLEIPSNNIRTPGDYNVSLCFAGTDRVVISDGCATIHVAKIKKTDSTENWEIIYSENIFDRVKFIVSDAKVTVTNSEVQLDIVVNYIEEIETEESASKSQNSIEWVTLIENPDGSWFKKSHRKLTSLGNIDYVAIEEGANALYIANDKELKFAFDSDKPIEPKELKKKVIKEYKWTQTLEDITIWFDIIEDVEKTDITVKVEDLGIHVEVKNKILLVGNFWGRVNKDLSVWSYSGGKLEIQLTKNETGQMWMELVKDNDKGEEIINAELAADVHARLSHLCSENPNEEPACNYNPQELEECDVSSETATIVRASFLNHKVTHEINLSSFKYLFKIMQKPHPKLCITHDLDACVWSLQKTNDDDSNWSVCHEGTFFAFGYVQASKTEEKYVVASPNFSYVAICEISKHIYIYKKPAPLPTELRNRRSGRRIHVVAKQLVVSLPTNDEILGAHASDTLLFILTQNNMFAVNIIEEEV